MPIHLAAWHDRLECVRTLVKQGSPMDAMQGQGRTPAHYVCNNFCSFAEYGKNCIKAVFKLLELTLFATFII